MSDGGKGDKRRPGDEKAFSDNFNKVFGDKRPERGSFVFDPVTNKLIPKAEFVPEPTSAMVMPDIKEYRSMVDGSMITSRSHHREHLKSNSLVEIGNETKYLKPKPKELPPGLKQRIAEIANAKLR